MEFVEKCLALPMQKADENCKQIPAFGEKYGNAQTEGIKELVQTDYMSSKHSDPGSADPVAFNSYQPAHGGGNTGLEVQQVEWRSSKVCILKAK